MKSKWVDAGVEPLILPCFALINSRGEILCSDAFTLHLWTPHTLSSQPNFHHQTQRLIRLTRIWGQLLYACACESVCGLLFDMCCTSAFCSRVHTEAKRWWWGGGFNLLKYDHFLGALESDWRPLWLWLSGSIRRHQWCNAASPLRGNRAEWVAREAELFRGYWLCREVVENPT